MGNMCQGTISRKKKKNSLIGIKSQNDNCYYKPKANSSSLLCFNPEKKGIREEILDNKIQFSIGNLFCKLGPGLYICIGGEASENSAFIIYLLEKKITPLPCPPVGLAYGRLNKYKEKIYVIGALEVHKGATCKAAAPLCFDLKLKKWSSLPEMPVRVDLSGSYIVHTYLYLIGGYINYPENPSIFSSLLIFDIMTESWVESKINTPIAYGLPNCTVLQSSDILIVGGHDPMQLVGGVSKKVYLFNGTVFEECEDLPEVGELQFLDDAVHLQPEVCIYTNDNVLFVYNIDKNLWTYQKLEYN